MKPLLSGLILTRNAATNIDKCINSIRWLDEIIIVDTGSTDETIKLAKKYTQKIYSFLFNDSFADARNFGILKTSGKWILVLDADEVLSRNVRKRVENLIKSKQYDGYWFARRNYINAKDYLKYGYFYPDFQLRLFRKNPQIRYLGKIHELLTIPNEKTKEVVGIEIFHNSSFTKYDSFLHFFRFFFYIQIEGKEIEQNDFSILYLLSMFFILPIRHTYRSFIRYEGYKDGYLGLRAAILWGMYEGAKYLYAFYMRIKKI